MENTGNSTPNSGENGYFDGAEHHIDMNPPHGEVEPLTGSVVFNEPVSDAPDNGFPIGYGPNAHLKKIEKPKKASLFERMKHARKKMTKKQKILAAVVPVLVVVAILGFGIYAAVTGSFKVDYSGTYLASKKLKTEVQKLRSDASCDKVIEYVNNQYTTMTVYQSYINDCKKVGDGVDMAAVEAVGDTSGVLKDDEVRRRYETLKTSFDVAKEGNTELNEVLDIYATWHEWIVAETSGNNAHQEWDWTDADMKKTSGILTDSDTAEFVKYGEDWYKYKKDAAEATNAYFHHALNTADDLVKLSDNMKKKQEAFTKWKKEKEPKVTEFYPLELVDTAALYAKFEEFYNFVKETYQNNYNKEVGGCKELVTAVVCE
jgi:hypothetical protein